MSYCSLIVIHEIKKEENWYLKNLIYNSQKFETSSEKGSRSVNEFR